MYISARERKILELLMQKNGETTVKELAQELDVSARTIHRDLKGVEDILKEYKIQLNKRSGIGISINGEKEATERLQLYLYNLSHNEYTPEERQTMVLSVLLDSTEPVKLVSLANELNVTIATISNDLNKVEERLTPFGISLIRKRGYGVELVGSEAAKRKAMSKIIIENMDEFEFISMIKENIQKKSLQTLDTVTDRLLGLVDKRKLLVIEKQIESVKHALPYEIADSAYIGLVVHLALAIERIQQGEEITFDSADLTSLMDTKEYKTAEKIAAGLEDVFQISISQGEIGYITMHLMGAKMRNDYDDLLGDSSLHVGMFVQNLIRYVSDALNEDLLNHPSLFQGLVAHLRPALYRIKQNMGISNPLLARIEQDYQALFHILQRAMEALLPELKVPKEEIGYLVMHFASALLSSDKIRVLKTLVICSSGIGTSKMLATKLEKEIPGIETVNKSIFDLQSTEVDQFDAIISTIPLKNFEKEYLLVSPLLSQDDVKKIKQAFQPQSRSLIKDTAAGKQDQQYEDFCKRVVKIKHYAAVIEQIMKSFTVLPISNPSSAEETIAAVCNVLYEEGIIDDREGVAADIARREEKGGLGIPGTNLSLYHTRSQFVRNPCFLVRRLETPLHIMSMEQKQMTIQTMLLMLSPEDACEEALEVLSTISALIIRDEQSISIFEGGDELKIANLLATEMNSLLQNQMKK